MLYIEVVVGLPVEGPFDYAVAGNLENKIAVGKRVLVPFRNQKRIGYIINIKDYSRIRKVKSIFKVIDDIPVLDEALLKLSREITKNYYCSLGEAVELILPRALRKGKKIEIRRPLDISSKTKNKRILVIQDLLGSARWQIYTEKIKEKLTKQQAVIFLVPEIYQIEEVVEKIKQNFPQDIAVFHSQQSERINLLNWQKVKNGDVKIAIGTRMAVFLPFSNLGLIIVDDENNPAYKEEQAPYYHTRNIAMIRAELERIEVIFSDTSPSLELLYLVKKKKIDYILLERSFTPQITVVDTRKESYTRRRGIFISHPLNQLLNQSLQNREKVLLFLNKKGFSTFIFFPRCRKVLRCPRCDINLTYYFKEKILLCHYCNYRTLPIKICPDCNSSYIRYSGAGTEKLESKLSLFYPAAKTLRYEKNKDISLKDIDFLISTEKIFRTQIKGIDYIVVLSLDNVLNRVDFRAAEYAFGILLKLLSLGPKNLLIQTDIPQHYCFEAIKNNDISIFYKEEMALRKQLKLPPLKHIAFIKLKGKNKERVKAKAELLFKKLKRLNKDKDIKVISCFVHTPAKLRDNYIWQIMLRADSIEKLNLFLKKVLRGISFSNIIINVDID